MPDLITSCQAFFMQQTLIKHNLSQFQRVGELINQKNFVS